MLAARTCGNVAPPSLLSRTMSRSRSPRFVVHFTFTAALHVHSAADDGADSSRDGSSITNIESLVSESGPCSQVNRTRPFVVEGPVTVHRKSCA
jgi:hypothetical protein